MRIGQVTQDNYKDYLKLLGVKNPKNLDKLQEKGGKGETADWKNKDYSHEAMEARAVAAGYIDEGMLIREGDESWKKIVDVPDSIRQKVIDKVREHFTINANGTGTAKQGDELAAIIKEYYRSLPPNERASACWTLEKIAGAEGQRLGDYVRSQVPGWQAGQSFDKSILTKSNYGLGENYLNVKA